MIRSTTPLFVLADRMRSERPRPGVDQSIAARIPQQNRAEALSWAALISGLSAAGTAWLLQSVGFGPWAVALLVVPAAFVALHAVFIANALLADGMRLGSKGRNWIWILGYTAVAAWFALCPGWISLAGGAWLIWMFIHSLAWLIDKAWRVSTGASQ
jgi:hypothetical protein